MTSPKISVGVIEPFAGGAKYKCPSLQAELLFEEAEQRIMPEPELSIQKL